MYVKIGYNINNSSKVNEVYYGKIYNGIGSGNYPVPDVIFI